MSLELFVPPHLREIGYGRKALLEELGRRAVVERDTHVVQHPTWVPWRGIFEYASCVEFARAELHRLPTGRALGGGHAVPARYHSASLVFFAQAMLDNIAAWLTQRFGIAVKGSDVALHKSRFQQGLTTADAELGRILQGHLPFIGRLEAFRQQWIHRLSGGAAVFSDGPPAGDNMHLAVPIDPSIGLFSGAAWLAEVEKCKARNGGRWLYPIGEFADMIADGCRELTMDLLERCLVLVPDAVR